ncbi:peptidyl-alpha-hydroxyglycine alpha-amidating lyase 2-like [Haliotis rufescens]|uniref:peptidyl-alpha-hydroxyglycine alpha-amidating lyase 2-like n=1 Tax=Haliotis rufescens TaxID=6454 RepID=UPI001EAF9026|nr:peptidyl-alpha-hydroxyglycine alpha-amidating lyase 2-like [Haliotis rufescens]
MSPFLAACVCAIFVTSAAYPYYRDLPEELIDEYLAYRDAPQAQLQSQGPVVNPKWPSSSIKLGQVTGVEAGPGGDVYLFHRGSRRWTVESFLPNNTYAQKDQGPIPEDTIVIVNGRTGKQVAARGANTFYMPHGLTLDNHGNLWVTDVALHQVMRFPKGAKEPDMVLGVKFEPGSDNEHFCKPTDVAVASNGDFFVSDGYCNSRIMKYSKEGKLLKTWGEKASGSLTDMALQVPHSLALVEKEDLICVADREDARVQCFNAGLKDATKTGQFIKTLFPQNAIGNVYAITYDPTGDVIYAVVHPETNADHARGYTISLDGRGLEEWWIDNTHRSLPHDVSVSHDGSDIYVGDISRDTAVKLERSQPVAPQKYMG